MNNTLAQYFDKLSQSVRSGDIINEFTQVSQINNLIIKVLTKNQYGGALDAVQVAKDVMSRVTNYIKQVDNILNDLRQLAAKNYYATEEIQNLGQELQTIKTKLGYLYTQ